MNVKSPRRAVAAPEGAPVSDPVNEEGVPRHPVQIFHRSAGAVVVAGDQCLLLRRGREWILPKGHIEQGERAEDAAVREVREETGVEIAIVDWIGSTRYEFLNRRGGTRNRKTVEWFLARRVGGELAVEPIFAEGAFVTREEALARLTHEADQDVARRAFELMTGAEA
jgi:ADP-ribose pyrophosphatase YjhB (NUDIX family)